MARFRHYLTTCATILALEQTLQDLQNSRDHVFTKFVTPDVVHRLQPFLIQTHRRSQVPPSTTVIANVRRQQIQTPTPLTTTTTTVRPDQPTPIVQIPHMFQRPHRRHSSECDSHHGMHPHSDSSSVGCPHPICFPHPHQIRSLCQMWLRHRWSLSWLYQVKSVPSRLTGR